MPNRTPGVSRRWIAAAFALMLCSTCADAADWVVDKTSGQVWVVSAKTQSVSLNKNTSLLPGDQIQTGPNGRVLLLRGEETILVAPNSVISLPEEPSQSGFTTILQQAGSIAVKAQKGDIKHFEVQTPYLAAVVKGTEFIVTIEPHAADVQVLSGEVEVADFQSGQVASLLRGQAARSRGGRGLILRGSGIFNLIRQSMPVRAVLQLVNVPKRGLRSPLRIPGRVVRTLAVTAGQSLSNARRFARIVNPVGNSGIKFLKQQLGPRGLFRGR